MGKRNVFFPNYLRHAHLESKRTKFGVKKTCLILQNTKKKIHEDYIVVKRTVIGNIRAK